MIHLRRLFYGLLFFATIGAITAVILAVLAHLGVVFAYLLLGMSALAMIYVIGKVLSEDVEHWLAETELGPPPPPPSDE